MQNNANTITVTNCEDCVLHEVQEGYYYCRAQKQHEMFMCILMIECPLPLTIQLKQNEQENI
jgi:hypothetical protein